MEVWFNSLDTPPAYVEVSCFPLPLSLSCATRRSIRFWFAAKKTVDSRCFFGFILFSEVLDLWPGLACRPPATAGVLLLEAELCVCFHCSCWEWKMGGTLGYLWVGPSGCVRRINCPLHTMYRQAFQWAKTSRVDDLGIQPQLFKTQRLSRCRAMWGWELK